jgi:hypothetical protein
MPEYDRRDDKEELELRCDEYLTQRIPNTKDTSMKTKCWQLKFRILLHLINFGP